MIYIIIWLCFGVFTAAVAASKGHNGALWFLIGALTGIFGFIASLFLSKKESKTTSNVEFATSASATPQFTDTRECPYCAETIKSKAVLCRFCGKDVEPVEQQPVLEPKTHQTSATSEPTEEEQKKQLQDLANTLNCALIFSKASDKITIIHKGKHYDFMSLKRAREFLTSVDS